MTTDDAHAFVDAHLGRVLSQFPDDVRHALRDQFVAAWLEPMTSELELVLRKRLTDDEVRHLLFAPTPAQYRHYATLLSLATAETDASAPWLLRLHKRFLALFCLQHAQNWPLVVEFCASEGLQVLCDLLQPHADSQIRAQAVDAFVQITSNAVFDWFDAPVGHQAKLLHAKMLALAAPGAGLLPRLIENAHAYGRQRADHEEVPAGATLELLQVLAFFLSWLRKLHTRDHELRLSRALLQLLCEWSTRTQTPLEEETELARRVYEDFSRWPPLEDTVDRVDASVDVDEANVDVDVDVQTSASSSVFSRAAVMALVADDAATDDALEQCIAACSDAITAGVAVVDAHLSRAQLRLKRTRRRHSPLASPDDDDIHAALADCSAVLALDPTYMDAWRCRLQLYSACGLWTEALAAVDALLSREADADADGLTRSLLPEDVRALKHEREELQRRAQAAEAQDAARRRALASRDAKMEVLDEVCSCV
ncbi:hypothetical protein PINS_up014072 [Pythium insidiosum]|nr:hypothetical protein PINS_up014072 [Pythium insidiosum]